MSAIRQVQPAGRAGDPLRGPRPGRTLTPVLASCVIVISRSSPTTLTATPAATARASASSRLSRLPVARPSVTSSTARRPSVVGERVHCGGERVPDRRGAYACRLRVGRAPCGSPAAGPSSFPRAAGRSRSAVRTIRRARDRAAPAGAGTTSRRSSRTSPRLMTPSMLAEVSKSRTSDSGRSAPVAKNSIGRVAPPAVIAKSSFVRPATGCPPALSTATSTSTRGETGDWRGAANETTNTAGQSEAHRETCEHQDRPAR